MKQPKLNPRMIVTVNKINQLMDEWTNRRTIGRGPEATVTSGEKL